MQEPAHLSGTDVIRIVKSLGFPIGSYVVFSGSTLAVHGIRETSDVDIVCTPELFAQCKAEGWTEYPKSDGSHYLKRADVELCTEVRCAGLLLTAEELIARAEVIDGIALASLEDVKAFKKAYGRAKDLMDLVFIDAYLAQ